MSFSPTVSPLQQDTVTDAGRMAYVDAALAERRSMTATNGHLPRVFQHRSDAETHWSSSTHADPNSSVPSSFAVPAPVPTPLPSRQPATLGKIVEVTPTPLPVSAPRQPKPARPRLGRDGKPHVPRTGTRGRRSSADMARDALVESLLHEHRPGISSAAAGSSLGSGLGMGGGMGTGTGSGTSGVATEVPETDDSLAERFQREYFEREREGHAARRDASSRGPSAPSKTAGHAGTKAEEERLKGPKLGGSRSQRAMMRERELEAQRERERKKR